MTTTHDRDGSTAGTAGKRAGTATGTATAGSREAAASQVWGEGLAYPEWMQRLLPALHDGLNGVNKYVSVPALQAGLGRYVSNPLTGYLMILRTRGRKSGALRDAPLGYTIIGEHVYCMAGFGRRTKWLQNVLADPHVEVILSSRAFSGLAEEVTDADERGRILPPLLRSMGVIVGMVGMGNPWRDTSEEIARKCEGMPLVRIRATGMAAGPEDPGGRFWVVPLLASAVLAIVLLRRRGGGRK